VCGLPMTQYATGWKCMNVKAHARALRFAKQRGLVRNPRGVNHTKGKIKGEHKAMCSLCENGKRKPRKGCTMCKGRGWVWATK